MGIETLGDLRHVCAMCGGSCQGNWVRLLGDEAERVERLAKLLNVEEPIMKDRLRHVNGRCVFLGEDDLCDIHRNFGMDAKPTVCKQYPIIAVRTEQGVRVGVDPGCYTHIDSWQQGPLVEDSALVASPVNLPEGQEIFEEKLLDLCSFDDVTLAEIAGVLCSREAADGQLPEGFAARTIQRLQAAKIDQLLAAPNNAPVMVSALEPVAKAIQTWSADSPPAWGGLGAEEEAFAISCIQRMLFLRLGHSLPGVAPVALLTLAGIVAAAWTNPDKEAFGYAVAGWTRAIRAQVFWMSLLPNPKSLSEWIAP